MTNIVNQDYWDTGYSTFNYNIVEKNDPIRKYIEKIFSNKKGQSVIEIGCFPGRYLSIFGELGYELNGIDITPRIKEDFIDFLKGKGYKIGNFIHGKFPSKDLSKYDIVCSIGFIEHFTNFLEIINEHTKLVKDNGYLIIFTPNFAYGFQKFFHLNFDKENINRHVLESMNPNLWEKEIKEQGFMIIDKGFYGGFDFWFDNEKRNILSKIFIYGLHIIKIITNKILSYMGGSLFNLPNHRNYSPYCFILAKKGK